jgi:hypothetical protein
MKKVIIVASLLLSCTTFIHAGNHFITDTQYLKKVETAFQEKMKLIGNQFFDATAPKTTEEKEALEFLYAYMPLADATDYTTDFYLQNVRSSLLTRQEMPWGSQIPELLFRHFVLPLRVNNENLDNSRITFCRELKERVKGMTMKEAILEVNHWCHEHVTYQPSDGRTLSPLACLKTAIGRCGEESTFTVAALRSIGIPARQVYTPRWAHTDDNHAWVEAWADGKWYFMGACEPEPVLNLGWFNAPASRAMLMHTRAFGDYQGPEEVMLRTSNFTEINLIGNYASTASIRFTIVDNANHPVKDARIDFKIYNYAEFCTVVTKYADANGKTFLTAGKGDMIVWASKDGHYGFTKASFGKDTDITIHLNRSGDRDITNQIWPMDSLNIVPPAEHAFTPEVTPEQRATNNLRFAKEDSIRKAYEATFITQEKATAYPEDIRNFLIKARGNWQVLLSFYNLHQDNKKRVIELLKALSDKDLHDIPLNILEDNYLAKSDQLCPRVEDEMIIAPFKQSIEKSILAKQALEFKQDPAKLVQWIKKNIRLNADTKALRIAQTPMGALKSGITDVRSRDILFVDIARSFNIEARKDIVTSKVQYKENGAWVDVDFDAQEQKISKTGILTLRYEPTQLLDDPKYYSHFTISRIENGVTNLLNFEEGQVDMGGGTSWKNTFKNGTPLDEGTYQLTTGTRLANGSVLATSQIFNIKAGKTTTLDLTMRNNSDEVSVIGNFSSESKFRFGINDVSLLSQTGRGYYVLGLIAVGQEPTNHAMRDIAKARNDLDKWERPMVVLFENEAEAEKFKSENYGTLPTNIIYGIDRDLTIRKQIATQMKLSNANQLPIFIIADTFDRVVFCSQGYTIGLGEQLKKVITKL